MDVFDSLFFVGIVLSTVPFVIPYSYTDMASNYVALMSLYNQYNFSKDFLPVAGKDEALLVYASLKLYAISDYDEVGGAIELSASLDLNWNDEMVQAIHAGTSFNNYSMIYNIPTNDRMTSFLVPYTSIWSPVLILKSATNSKVRIGDSAYLCRYYVTNGTVKWSPRMLMKSACSPDVTYYPFDRQTCTLALVAWGHTELELKLVPRLTVWDLTSFEENGEWTIVETQISSTTQDDQSQLDLSITIERKPQYFLINMMLPIILLCLLNGMVFWLPIDSGERVGFSVTCFLSFVVLLNTIMEFMPRTSSPISYLCYYLVVMMMMSGIVTAVVILEIRMYHKSDETEKVPKWLRTVIMAPSCFRKCSKLRCCRCCNNIPEVTQVAPVQMTRSETEPGKDERTHKTSPTRITVQSPREKGQMELACDRNEKIDSADVTWKEVVNLLDKLLFICFIGGEVFFSVSFILPLFHRA